MGGIFSGGLDAMPCHPLMPSCHTMSSPGGLDAMDVALCAIEKANLLTNKRIDENNIDKLGK